MDEATAKKLLERAKICARKLGFNRFADDLSQDVLQKYLEGKGQHQTVGQAVIDAVRARFGSTRTPSHELRRLLEFDQCDLSNVSNLGIDPRDGEDFDSLIKCLKGRDRAIVVLLFKWGFREKEVAECFGIHESRVSQLLHESLKKMFTENFEGEK